ncbi:MAG: hypothetical protein C0601_04860 [Candidatus Muiribacterium halophilum]|uniref:Uncharacterized protein n=1 Tax=Muiribacterium halophilum TaxID=2053465 RepID=A0A2N5ZI75_MUIH1|nr:MAG: hypothetical protein C0601_04860 [Candidatus Muirbacterium halophilum]
MNLRHKKNIIFLTTLAIAFILPFLLKNTLNIKKRSIQDVMNSKIIAENSIYRLMSNIRSRDSFFIKKNILDDLKYSERIDNAKVSLEIKKKTEFAPFFNQGYFFSDETGGMLKINSKVGGTSLEIIIPFSFYRYTSPFSGYFSLFIKNTPSENKLNSVLNNALGDSLNNVIPTRIFSSDSLVFLGNRKRIILNLANGSGKYGEGFILPDQTFKDGILKYYFGSSAGIKSHNAFENYKFSKKEYYSSIFHLSGNILKPSNPRLIGDIFKGYFYIGALSEKKEDVENALILPYANMPAGLPKKIIDDYSSYMSKYQISKYNNNTTEEKEFDFKNKFDRGRHLQIDNLNETAFFSERITVRKKDLSSYIQSNGFNNILDLKKEILFLDSDITYIPFINIVKNGGVIMATNDIYIDTIKNPLEKPLTLISLNGKILIGGEVHASLITMSPNGGIEGTYKRKKTIEGNLICSNFNSDSFKTGLDIFYTPIYSKPYYNFKLIPRLRAAY